MGTGATDDSANLERTHVSSAGGADTSQVAVAKAKKSFARALWQRSRNWLYWFFPNWSAVNWADQSYERSHDAKENKETSVPEELELRVPVVWGCELYGPGEIDDLYLGLRKLGWGIPHREGDNDGIEKWIRENRAYGRQGGWLNGGHVINRGEKETYVWRCNYASLPSGVLSLHVEVFQLTPSLTAVSVMFRLNDAAARCYEDEINRERLTYRKRIPRSRSISIIGPRNQKHDDVARVRSALRRLVADWYKQHLPGYFSAQDRQAVFPIMELLAVKKGPILHAPTDAARQLAIGWRWLLNQTFHSHVWTSQRNDAIQLAMSDMQGERQGRTVTVALDESRFSEESMKMYGGKSTDSLAYLCGEELRYILPYTATIEYLREQTRYLNLNREQLKRARSGRANLRRTLLTISQFFDQTLGVPALARELVEQSKWAGWYRLDVEFTAPGWKPKDTPRKLSDELQAVTKAMASRLASEEVAMRDHFDQLSSILSIHESVNVQRWMLFATILALVVTALSLLVALVGQHTVAEWFNSLWTPAIKSA